MLFILIISFFCCVFSQDFVQESNVIQVGEYTNLISVLNFTNYLDLFKHNIFRWYYGKNDTSSFIIDIKNNTILKNIYLKKATTFTIDNKIILQIKNITKDYKKYKFYCYYYNYKYENTFKKLTDLTFFNPFSSENMKIKYVVQNMKLIKININFKKIFPIPKCFVKINNESFFPRNIIQNKTLNYLYSQVNLNMKIKEINCSYEIEIICTLLNQTITINSKNNTCIFNLENLMYSITSILIILFLIFSIILLIFIYFKRKKILYSLINKIKK